MSATGIAVCKNINKEIKAGTETGPIVFDENTNVITDEGTVGSGTIETAIGYEVSYLYRTNNSEEVYWGDKYFFEADDYHL